MSGKQPSSAPIGDVIVDEEVQLISQVLASAVWPYIRQEGRLNFEQFAARVQAGMGGTLVLTAPSLADKRKVAEVQFATGGLTVTAGGGARVA